MDRDPKRAVSLLIEKVEEGGATSADYTGVPTSVTFDSGETVRSFTFSAAQDAIDDDGELVLLSFSSTMPAGITALAPRQTTILIADDDSAGVTVDPTVLTIAERATSSYSVALDSEPTHDVTVTINSPNETAISTDKSLLNFTASNWHMIQSVVVLANADEDTHDYHGSITHTIESLDDEYVGATSSDVIVRVIDDDVPQVTISFGKATYHVDEGGDVSVEVILDSDPGRNLTIPIEKTDQGGITGADYFGVPSSVSFNPGDTVKSFTVYTTQDSLNDDNELVKFSFGVLPDGVSVGTLKESAVSITDDDVPKITVTFERANYFVSEGQSTTIKVFLNRDPERTLIIPIEITKRGRATNADYFGVPNSLTFGYGETEESFTFSATPDSVDDDSESVELSFGDLSNAVSAGVYKETTVSIVDDDVPLVLVSFGRAKYSVDEGDDVTVKVTLSAAPERTVNIPIARAERGGATGADYSGVPTGVSFNPGDTEKSFTFSAADDTVDDDDESVKLSIGRLPTLVFEGAYEEAIVSISDGDDPSITVSFSQSAYTVAEGSTTTLKVTFSGDPERTVVIPIMKENLGGATSTDYSGVPSIITFNPGDTEKSFTFSATDDTVDDDDESVKLSFGRLPNLAFEGVYKDATVSIADDDDPAVTVNFAHGTYAVAEGSTTTISVTLSGDPERTVIIPITKYNQGGATSTDYFGVPASLTFNPGDTEKSFTFSAKKDSADDDSESVRLTFGSLPSRVSFGNAATSTVTITENRGDKERFRLGFEKTRYTAVEGSSVIVGLLLDIPLKEDVTIPIHVVHLYGANSDDYSGVPASITIEAGDIEKSFTFTAARDNVDDRGESVELQLLSPFENDQLDPSVRTRILISEGWDDRTATRAESLLHDCWEVKETLCALAPQYAISGKVVPEDDRDWFKMSLIAGGQYHFFLLLNTIDLKIHDGTGRELFVVSHADMKVIGWGYRSAIFEAPTTDGYYVEVTWSNEVPYFLHRSSYGVRMIEQRRTLDDSA